MRLWSAWYQILAHKGFGTESIVACVRIGWCYIAQGLMHRIDIKLLTTKPTSRATQFSSFLIHNV